MELSNFAQEVNALMRKRAFALSYANPKGLNQFLRVISSTSAYIDSLIRDERSAATERQLGDDWEKVYNDAMIAEPKFAMTCGDVVLFWRDPDAYLHGEPLAPGSLMFLATKFTRFG